METVDETELEWQRTDHDPFAFRRKQLGAAGGGDDLGCSLYEVPPDKRAWPRHYHSANEEALYILDGAGELRGPGDERRPIEPGTYVSLPAGPEGTHAVENTGSEPLRYLALSTMGEPDVLVYPDSEKIGVMTGAPPGGESDERLIDAYFKTESAVDYWTDED